MTFMTENENRIEELTSTSSTQTNHSSPPPPPPPLISISLPDCDSSSSSSSEEEEEFHETVEDPIELNLNSAETLKSEGNTHFGKSHWRDALNLYTQALLLLPLPHQTPSSSTSNQKKVSDSHSSSSSSEAEVLESEVDLKNSINDPDPRLKNLRSTLNANSAACHLKLEDWKSAVEASTASLRDNPTYPKALHRRAQANENINTWATLQAALDDYNTLAQLSNLPIHLNREIGFKQTQLPSLIKEQSEIEKAEMMSKLKDIGNTVLGKFGLSTDNFKFTPNETGGYSMAFER